MIVALFTQIRRVYTQWRIDCAREELNDRLLDGSASAPFVVNTLMYVHRLEGQL